MFRLDSSFRRSFRVGALLAIVLAGTVAHAETQAEIAAKENQEGKDLMFAKNYAAASAKFQDAVARVPEAKYFFNLCMSLYQEGKFGQALTACHSAEKNNADDHLKAKAAKLEQQIQDEAKKQGIALEPVGGGGGETNVTDPNGTNPNGTNPNGTNSNGTNSNGTTPNGTNPNGTGQPPAQPAYAVGRPPSQGLFTSTKPDNSYTWTLGVDLFGGGARLGTDGVYKGAAGGIRFKGDYMIAPAARFGMQGYIQLTSVPQADMTTTGGSLSIFDLGLAAYKDFCPANGRFCLTPLAGLQLALMDPGETDSDGTQLFNYAALGARVEANASVAFGSRYEYVFQGMLGANLYTGVFSSPSDGFSASMLGLDKGGVAVYAGLGFTYRFDTPFGQAPFITLE